MNSQLSGHQSTKVELDATIDCGLTVLGIARVHDIMAVAFTLLGLLMSNARVTYQQSGVSLGFTVALFNGQHV